MKHTLTTIKVDGQHESVFEVYADESKSKTIGYVLEEKTAILLEAAPLMYEALKQFIKDFDETRSQFSGQCLQIRNSTYDIAVSVVKAAEGSK